MQAQDIFGLQFLTSLIVWGVIARLVFSPWLRRQTPSEALFWLTLPHAFRHMGMVFLVPTVVGGSLPSDFAGPAAYGDLLTGFLALATLLALRSGWSGKLVLVWVFNVFGTVDLVNALRHVEVAPTLGAAWYIPTLFVPLLLVTHVMVFARLLQRRESPAALERHCQPEGA